MSRIVTFLSAALMGCALAPSAQAQTLINLTTANATIADGDRLCPQSTRYKYSGGRADGYDGGPDDAYPSSALVSYLSASWSTTQRYDKFQNNEVVADSFALQYDRSVCHAIIKFKAKQTGDFPSNDTLSIGHTVGVGIGASAVARVINPGSSGSTQSYALDATGLALLSLQTGVNLDKSPQDSVLDMWLQDDTKLDFFTLHVWYGPNCAQTGTCP